MTARIGLSYPTEEAFKANLSEIRTRLGVETALSELSSDHIVLSRAEVIALFNKEGFSLTKEAAERIKDEISITKNEIPLGWIINIFINI